MVFGISSFISFIGGLREPIQRSIHVIWPLAVLFGVMDLALVFAGGVFIAREMKERGAKKHGR